MASGRFNPKIIEGESRMPERNNYKEELKNLETAYTCEPQERPRWCVFGEDATGYKNVIYWIRPLSNDEFVAHKMARLLLYIENRKITAEMTEWNPDLKGEPIYRQGRGEKEPPKGPFGPDLSIGI